MGNFYTLFPNFSQGVGKLYHALIPVAVVLCFASLLMGAYRSMLGGPAEAVRKIMLVGIIAVISGQLVSWTSDLQLMVQTFVQDELKANPADVHKRFNQILADPENQVKEKGFWGLLFSSSTSIAEAFASAIVWLVGKIASLIVWWAYLIQTAVYLMGISLAPIFLGMLTLNTTRSIGISYLMGLIGIACWPLGWAVANIMTDSLLQAAADKSLVNYLGSGGDTANAMQTLFFTLAVSLWLIFSTIAAPVLISKVLSSGAQIGTAMIGGFAGAVGAGVAAGASAGASTAISSGVVSAGSLASGASGVASSSSGALISNAASGGSSASVSNAGLIAAGGGSGAIGGTSGFIGSGGGGSGAMMAMAGATGFIGSSMNEGGSSSTANAITGAMSAKTGGQPSTGNGSSSSSSSGESSQGSTDNTTRREEINNKAAEIAARYT